MSGIYAQVSCSMTRDPRMIAAGWQARAVYVEAILYCRENLTDGIIDRLALPYWMPDLPVKARGKLLDHLVHVGALTTCEQGWMVPRTDWRANDMTRREFNRRRWHVYCRRHEIFDRDGNACVRCGSTERLEVDHIIAMINGGDDEDENLQTLCKPCNAGKRDR